MTFEIIKGDLFDESLGFDALAQGVNTYGVMGGGIAVPFRQRWPEMYEEYHKMCLAHGETLGGLMHLYVKSMAQYVAIDSGSVAGYSMITDPGIVIYNLFSQIKPGADGDYDLLKKATILMLQDAEYRQVNRVGLPWIGCGIAGLERHNVKYIFEQLLSSSDVEFVLVEQ